METYYRNELKGRGKSGALGQLYHGYTHFTGLDDLWLNSVTKRYEDTLPYRDNLGWTMDEFYSPKSPARPGFGKPRPKDTSKASPPNVSIPTGRIIYPAGKKNDNDPNYEEEIWTVPPNVTTPAHGNPLFGGPPTSPASPPPPPPPGSKGRFIDLRPNASPLRFGGRRFTRYPGTRKRVARVTRRRGAGWIDSLNDPCNVKGVRIPDLNIFPTLTTQIKIIRTITPTLVDGVWGVGLVLNPKDLFNLLVLDVTEGSSRLVSTITAGNGATPFATTYWTKAMQDAQPDILSLQANASEGRIVSACIRAHYIGNSDKDQGVLAGGLLRGRARIAGSADDQGIATSDLFEDSSDTNIHKPAEGVMVKWVPSSEQDTKFVEMTKVKVAGTSYNGSASGIAIYAHGLADAAAEFRCEIFINVEYVPAMGAAPGARAAGFDGRELTRVTDWATNTWNFITNPDNRQVVQTAAAIGVAGGRWAYRKWTGGGGGGQNQIGWR